jgi:DEAD/DEAH box helicase domain-containing protein
MGVKDKIVIDIETKNTFEDVGGRDNLERLDVSLAVVYSYTQDRFIPFRDTELHRLGPMLQNARLVIGFATHRFDLPVLQKYVPFNIMALPRLDILEEIEAAYGSRISLDILAKANLGTQKTSHGLQAIEFYKNGEWDKLIEYCEQDVRITKQLYDLIQKQGFINIPKRWTNEIIKVPLNFKEAELPATLF